MSGAEQVESVQQEIADVVRKVSDLEASLSAAEQAGDGDKVSFLRSQLQQLYKEKVALREKENLLLRAHQGGEHCPLFHHPVAVAEVVYWKAAPSLSHECMPSI